MKVYPHFITNNNDDNNECMFCNKQTNVPPLYLSYSYGFINCTDCKHIAEKSLNEWIEYNKKISWLFFFESTKYNINIENDSFIILRSNGKIENDWFININGWIEYSEKCSDYLLPFVKLNSTKQILFKNISLTKLCELNTVFNYEFIKNIISKWI